MIVMRKTNKLIGIALIVSLMACEGGEYTPKPKGYFRIDLPKKEYKQLEKDCPFTFEVPTYTSTRQNKNNPDKPCWFDLVFDDLNASIYLSYKPVNNDVNQFLDDSRTLAFKHTVKANDIEQKVIQFPDKKVYGLIYSIEGNAASAYQFHLTDSTNHFLRGSLYFNNVPNYDSIQPVLNYVKEDIEKMIETFEWQ